MEPPGHAVEAGAVTSTTAGTGPNGEGVCGGYLPGVELKIIDMWTVPSNP